MKKLNITIRETSRAEEAQELADFFAGMARDNDQCTSAMLEVPSAIMQLLRSERGYRAFVAFRNLVDGGGHGLDRKNWAALATLCRAQGYIPPAFTKDEPTI
jgi:hypothetical protein